MRRYIDADALLNTLFEIHCKECDKRKGEKNGKYKTIYEVGEAPCKSCGVNDMREYIEDAPTADVVEVVHEEWVVKGQEVYCSKCKKTSGYNWNGASAFSKFCPNCGAKMDLH